MPKSAGNSNVEKLQTGEDKILIILVGINQDDDSRINNIEFGYTVYVYNSIPHFNIKSDYLPISPSPYLPISANYIISIQPDLI
ncbi:MAG: hypothetical protein F6K18_29895 [Okeania sp. SIO2C2]|uniref:hypothetical protein n=1 Tax=unclassified Okeania TaxID=2634635 RepID=UPI0013BA986D|nr:MULTISPECIES: hypothetical protein [unclassified Okeania]NEP08104.1 hypothetical protein [Okeania sp. SIO4D6]NEP43571.1 hypothetical protein [Okeania sp. SIO2H7]NEP76100.1 hypothetical protein [Okeania sp. SIO2G5]NEP90691.1 hypothetical protein [Okeania sp. SIO2C2]NEP97275.1 hypothetical protein [Okeania sp. SIO2F5]